MILFYIILSVIIWLLSGYIAWAFNKGYYVYKYPEFAEIELKYNGLFEILFGLFAFIEIILFLVENYKEDKQFYKPIFTLGKIRNLLKKEIRRNNILLGI